MSYSDFTHHKAIHVWCPRFPDKKDAFFVKQVFMLTQLSKLNGACDQFGLTWWLRWLFFNERGAGNQAFGALTNMTL